ncbi:MAG: YwiC-like family protein, partial [Chloroflexota bacterium]
MQKYFKRQIALPQDHGSWVFILGPLLVGIFAGKTFSYATFNLIIAAMAAFMLRQPLSIIVKAYSGRRSREDLPPAQFWAAVYGLIAVLALVGLILEGFGYILYLAIPGIPVFAWHLWLVSRRAERRQAGVEVIATGVLSLVAPAAYWIGIGQYDPSGWWLWLLTWLQSAASIVHAYLRLEQRGQAKDPERSEQWKMGSRALAYTSFNLALTIVLGILNVLPRLIFVPFAVQWLETLWGITHPAT